MRNISTKGFIIVGAVFLLVLLFEYFWNRALEGPTYPIKSESSTQLSRGTVPLFSKVEYRDSAIEITFKDQRGRSLITLNGEKLGVNTYGQMVTLAKTDTLLLNYKNGSYRITPVVKSGIWSLDVQAKSNHNGVVANKHFIMSVGN